MSALSRISRGTTALLLFAVPAFVAAQEHPNVARGFSRDKAFQIGDVDHINLFNGNLVLTVPLGQSYPVGGGLSFGLTLTYNSNAWDFDEHTDQTQVSFTQALPGLRFNAGLGWLLTLGQLNPPRTSISPEGHEVYLGPDGAEHAFYLTLHDEEPVLNAVQYTRDGSYLRLRGASGGPREVDFPDGTIHRFDSSNRLIQIRSRFLTAGGQPADTVEITYPSTDFWTIKTTVDGFTRTQTVHFRSGLGSYSKLVDYVEVATWNNPSPPARYTFNYSLVTIQRPCPHNDQIASGGLPLAAAVPLLVSLTRPDGSQVSMPASDYFTDLGGTTCASPWNGSIRGLTLPTFGRLEWDYQTYAFPIDSSSRPFRQRSAGVAHRRLRTTPTDPNPYVWTYTTAITPFTLGSAAEELVNTVTDPLNNKTENYFAIFAKTTSQPTNGTSLFEYGLPISHLTQDGSGRFLSTRTFNGSMQLIRSTYAKYEFDSSPTVPPLEERSRLNQRAFQNETVYHDDSVVPPADCTGIGTANPCRVATVVSSDFDGLGHYRTTTTGGNFGNADIRTTFTNYNPGRGSYPGSFVPPTTSTAPWVLETFDRMTESEGGFTSRVDTCFDPATGFLKRKRVYKTGASPATEDVVAVMTPDVQGNVMVEESYGGDNAGLDTVAPLCTMNPGTSRYRTAYTYQYGVRATAQATSSTGGIPTPINFKTLNLTIDPSTGLPNESRDSVGWRTTYKYDALGRVTEIKPLAGPVAGPVGAWTRYTYNRATSGSNPATVDAQSCASTSSTCTTPLEQSQLVFDYLGRLTKDRHRMPNGAWSKQVTTYNGNGWKDFVSETQADSTNDGSLTGTKYRSYDPFGRPGMLIPADGTAHQVTLAYEGVRKTLRTAKVATSYNPVSGNATETSATTTEISDRQGRLAQVIEPNNISTIYNYDVDQRLRRVCQNSNATGSTCGQERLFTYDNRGFLTSERHPEKGASGNGTVTYSLYDPRGHAGRKQDGPANLTFTYDLAERLTDVTETATGRPLKKFTFGIGTSDKGKLAKAERWNYRFLGGSVNTALITETYQYLGRDGRPSQRDTTLTFAGTTNEHFVQTFGYDELGMLEAQSYPNCTGFAACTSAGRTVSNVYTEGRLTAVSGYTGTAPGQTMGIGITYHPNGQVNQVAHVNSVVATYGLDPNNLPRPASISASKAGTTLWDTGTYKYDGSGNIWKIGTSWFEYDSLSRLITGAVFPAPLGGGTQQKQSSAFDVYGNLQSLTTQIGAAGATTRLTTTNAATNRLASPSTYDSAGDLTNWNGAFYEYDGLNQMARFGSGTEDWFYIYTADDERVWSFKPAQGATPRFDRWTLRGLDGQVLREYPISGYVWNNWEDNVYRDGQLLANYLSSGQRRHFDLDHLGTPRLLTNLAGTVTSYHVYYPFGEEATSSTQDTERLKFTGHERDLNNQTGSTPSADDLDYMHARFCSPVTGRFLETDLDFGSVRDPQSWNRYTYVRSNPLNATDPRGLWPLIIPLPYFSDSITVVAQAVAPFAVKTADTLIAGRRSIATLLGLVEAYFGRINTRHERPPKPGEFQLKLGIIFPIGPFMAEEDILLQKQLASEEQLGEILSEGNPIAGAGTLKPVKDIARIVEEYGGNAKDWAKVRSSNFRAEDGSKFEVHAYKNVETGQVVEVKTKFQ